MLTQEIDGWAISVTDEPDSAHPIKVVAASYFGDSEYATGKDLESALLYLAKKIHVDRQELLTMYGLS